jgi:hypothetical protein
MAVINIFQLAARKNLIQVSLNVITIVMVIFDTSDLFSTKVSGLSRHCVRNATCANTDTTVKQTQIDKLNFQFTLGQISFLVFVDFGGLTTYNCET